MHFKICVVAVVVVVVDDDVGIVVVLIVFYYYYFFNFFLFFCKHACFRKVCQQSAMNWKKNGHRNIFSLKVK